MPYTDKEQALQYKLAYKEKANENRKKSRAKNIEKEKERAKLKRVARRQLLWIAKDRPCMDCGVKFNPWVMDFDHRPDEVKVNHVSHMLGASIESLLEEISKCDVVCSNCHRNRTYLRSGFSEN